MSNTTITIQKDRPPAAYLALHFIYKTWGKNVFDFTKVPLELSYRLFKKAKAAFDKIEFERSKNV